LRKYWGWQQNNTSSWLFLFATPIKLILPLVHIVPHDCRSKVGLPSTSNVLVFRWL
jgi:hypothetical protein